MAQWMPPPPSAMASISNWTTSRPGWRSPITAAARRSALRSPKRGTSTTSLAR
ncbi:hypothetical protein SAMN05421870_11718 [Streptomyces qinglanensis]|uniref:Uncharacterized protein n=1 Tax=Streptomyces qinglanensis TaxID=943816 RepID=A0A1H9WE48_9ACTN|nr:hypothetical protein SAMN05421870_11718 [Streptomyces qinglanensis]